VTAALTVPADAAPTDTPSPSPTPSYDVPVAATFSYDGHREWSEGTVHGAINAVVRIPGGTAVYYSLGGPGDSNPIDAMPSIGLDTPYNVYDAWSVGIVDPRGMNYYLPLATSDDHCLCSQIMDITDPPHPTTPVVGYAVLPPLPAGLKTVTVMFGFGTVLQDVPVTDQLPGPVTSAKPVELGSGWPALPSQSAIEAADTRLSIRPLTSNTANPQATTKKTDTSTSIALDSSVLFTFNKATLTAKANTVLDDVAATISKSAHGTVTIVGYTDSTGSDAYNQTLSEKRADAVEKALRARLADAHVSFRASGRGENDPVAANTTAAGRALNRRVTVTFDTGAH
jgi:outer membrane protein OmpA-like peptidoglycan-associated protein